MKIVLLVVAAGIAMTGIWGWAAASGHPAFALIANAVMWLALVVWSNLYASRIA